MRAITRITPGAVQLSLALVGLWIGCAGCDTSKQGRRDERGDAVDAGVIRDAAHPAARELPRLEPSGLTSIQVVTGGASDAEPLPLVIALHGNGGDPATFSQLAAGFEHKARFIFPRGPYALGKGRAWVQPRGGDAMARLNLKSSADAVAALADEIAASKATKGKAIVTGFSQGGVVAFLVAARQPERVDAVVPMGAWLPRFAWPEAKRFLGNRPILRALNGTDDEVTEPGDVRRSVVKLRMLKLDATVRLYSGAAHEISPAMRTDLFRMLSWLTTGTGEPAPCEPCPGDSMDPEACSLCSGGQPEPAAKAATRERPDAKLAPAPAPEGPDIDLGSEGISSKLGKGGQDARGALSREEIQRTFRRNMASIRYCYDRQLTTNPGLEGRISVRLVIALDGTVSSASIASSTLGNSTVEECVRRAVTRVRFPQPRGGVVIVTYPFTFASTGR